jgi:hypothetical protein
VSIIPNPNHPAEVGPRLDKGVNDLASFRKESSMPVRQVLLAAVPVLAFLSPSTGYPRAPAPIFRDRGASELPVGRWTATFANGVVEECEIRREGTVGVVEPKRAARGKAKIKGRAVVIVFDDDRVERWTTVGQRMVVEHWFPAAQYPLGTPVLGKAERSR